MLLASLIRSASPAFEGLLIVAETVCRSTALTGEPARRGGGPVATAPGSDKLSVATARASPQPRGNGSILPGLHRPDGSKAARTRSSAYISSSEKIKGR